MSEREIWKPTAAEALPGLETPPEWLLEALMELPEVALEAEDCGPQFATLGFV